MKEEQITRILSMTKLYQEAQQLLKEEKVEELLAPYQILDEYYTSELWRQDYDADEAGFIPKNICREILTEDCLYDFLDECDQLFQKCSYQVHFKEKY